jgi:hypothetical protein
VNEEIRMGLLSFDPVLRPRRGKREKIIMAGVIYE